MIVTVNSNVLLSWAPFHHFIVVSESEKYILQILKDSHFLTAQR